MTDDKPKSRFTSWLKSKGGPKSNQSGQDSSTSLWDRRSGAWSNSQPSSSTDLEQPVSGDKDSIPTVTEQDSNATIGTPPKSSSFVTPDPPGTPVGPTSVANHGLPPSGSPFSRKKSEQQQSKTPDNSASIWSRRKGLWSSTSSSLSPQGSGDLASSENLTLSPKPIDSNRKSMPNLSTPRQRDPNSPLQDRPTSWRKSLFGTTTGSMPSPGMGETELEMEEKRQNKSKLGSKMNYYMSPFTAWFRGKNVDEAEALNNPLLHLAHVAMNMSMNEQEFQGEESEDKDEDKIHSATPTQARTAHSYLDALDEQLLALPSDDDDDDESSSVSSLDMEEHQLTNQTKTSLVVSDKVSSHSMSLSRPKKSIEEKIQLAFELPKKEAYRAEFACWLVRSVLLKGYMYLTEGHLCFCADIPSDIETKSGYLQKRSSKSAMYSTYWIVLKDSVLLAYENSTEVFFPATAIPLKHVLDVRLSKASTKGFTIVTNRKKYRFYADTEILCTEWMKALRASVFKARNLGDDVRVVFPFSFITDVLIERSDIMAEFLKIKVMDDETGQVEDYDFAYFGNIEKTATTIKDLLQDSKRLAHTRSEYSIFDTTATSKLPAKPRPSLSSSSETLAALNETGIKSTTLAIHTDDSSFSQETPRPTRPRHRKSLSEVQVKVNNPFMDESVLKPPSSSRAQSNSPTKRLHQPLFTTQSALTTEPDLTSSSSSSPIKLASIPVVAVDEPDFQPLPRRSSQLRRGSTTSSHKKTLSEGGDILLLKTGQLSQMGTPPSSSGVVSPSLEKENELREEFALSETDHLVGSFNCYLLRVIPRLGRMYLTEQHICFKSTVAGVRAKAIIPLSEVVSPEKETGLLYSSLVIHTKCQDDVTFDFHTSEARNRCHALLLTILQVSRSRTSLTAGNSGRLSAVLDDESKHDPHIKSDFSRHELTQIQVQPLSSSHNILYSKPSPMHITCLTIGTRGDVQPYIALCKRLMADGHTCRIATHLEYQSWIEGFGIEFREVKGNPAELMRLCVDNGMFTIAFVREALSKFLGWIDELLLSCWDSVQGTDLLIESPTAMGGIHCAEKLQIPFFSAFPMPWTRTRVYPHPFGVPERQLGGSYNLMSHVMMENILLRGIAPQVNRWRKKNLGLPTMNLASLVDQKIPFLYSFSPSVVPHPYDWPDWIHTCGYWFLDNPEHNWIAPPSLVKFMNEGPRPVYIGFGSIVVPDPEGMTRTIVDAVVKAGVRVILSKGWSGRLKDDKDKDAPIEVSTTIEYPSCIYPLDKVPHDWLFPQMAGVVHHGGAGTTAAGLRAGVPTLIRPFFGDQYFWAERVQELGVGISIRKLTIDKLASALVTLTTDTRMRERASRLGDKIQKEDGTGEAVRCIYRDLGYAKERIAKQANSNR